MLGQVRARIFSPKGAAELGGAEQRGYGAIAAGMLREEGLRSFWLGAGMNFVRLPIPSLPPRHPNPPAPLALALPAMIVASGHRTAVAPAEAAAGAWQVRYAPHAVLSFWLIDVLKAAAATATAQRQGPQAPR